MLDFERRDWILPGVALVLLFVGFGVLRLTHFGPPEGWTGEQGPFPFKRMERQLLLDKTRQAQAHLPRLEPRVRLQGGPELRWSADGRSLAGLRQGDTPALGHLDGEEVQVFALPGLQGAPHGLAWHPQGLLLFSAPDPQAPSRAVLMASAWTRQGAMAPKRLLSDERLPGEQLAPDPSEDGHALVLLARTADGDRLIYWDRSRDELRELAAGVRLADPALSPDGAEVAFASQGEEGLDLLRVPVDGGEAELVAGGPGDQRWPMWCGDGGLVWFDAGTLRSTAGLGLVGLSEVEPARAGDWVAALRGSRLVLVHPDGTGLEEHPLAAEPVGFDVAARGDALELAWAWPSGEVTVEVLHP